MFNNIFLDFFYMSWLFVNNFNLIDILLFKSKLKLIEIFGFWIFLKKKICSLNEGFYKNLYLGWILGKFFYVCVILSILNIDIFEVYLKLCIYLR